METLRDFRGWVDEFVLFDGLPSHDWLIERVRQALDEKRGPAHIVVRGPLELRIMRKVGLPGDRLPPHT
jgi:hypothetical protein